MRRARKRRSGSDAGLADAVRRGVGGGKGGMCRERGGVW